ncbi:hypothetical protein AAE02nite_35720 [Adhaeribacter aerolatus]|uniref:Uncharacterized protein n=1 Tax=Adhaeribacter aerolatus TaxID=670289 RepID=A0A512B1Q1_9BACT|nr:hypothetical protein [Adhaeribacter aerolatus]GEO05908.1 hypothetical protein AAE02nite_35720 [Adhaeribacter aerolatus]
MEKKLLGKAIVPVNSVATTQGLSDWLPGLQQISEILFRNINALKNKLNIDDVYYK